MIDYINKFDKGGECAVQGKNAEVLFKEILVGLGFSVREASKQEQMSHVDLISVENNRNIRYEIKARKKINRRDGDYQDALVWIEIQNVIGDLGWLFGAADFLVFERDKDFIVVERQKLADFVSSTCNLRKIARNAGEALYASYRRFGRKDLLTMIKEEDIVKLAKKVYLK